MQFTTSGERSRYFEEIRGGNVSRGSAQEHASTVNLGVWGDRQALADDCARIFAEEIVMYCRDTGEEYPIDVALDLVHAITMTPAFDQLFRLWRRGIDHQTETALSVLIESQSSPPALRELEDTARELLENPHCLLCESLSEYAGKFRRQPYGMDR